VSFVLYGDSSKPGLYLQYQRRAPNNWSAPPDSSTTSRAGSTTTGRATMRCGFWPQASGPRPRSMSTRRS